MSGDGAAVNVTIGATIDDLIKEFQKASQQVTTSVADIAESTRKSMQVVEDSSNRAATALDRIGKESEENSERARGAFGNLGGFLTGMLGPLLAGFSLQRATATVMEFANTAESLQKTAQIAGTTATAISRLHAAAEPLGIATDQVDGGLKKLSKNMVDAARGGDETAKAFEAVGLKASDLKSMSPDQVMAKIADKFAATEDGATKTAVAMALFGKSGADLIPMLNQGSEKMADVADEAAAMGAVMGEDAVAAGAKLDDALDKLNVMTTGVKNTFALALAPTLEFIAEMFTSTSGVGMDFGAVFKGIGTIVIGVTAVIRSAWEVVASIVRGITIALTSVTDAIIKVATGDFSGAKNALVIGKDMIVETFQDLDKNVTELQQNARNKISSIWNGAAPDEKPDLSVEGPKSELEFADKGDGGAAAKAEAAKKAAEDAKRKAQEEFEYKMELMRNELSEIERGAEAKLAVAARMTETVRMQYGEQSKEYARAQREELRITEEVEAERRRIKDGALQAARTHGEHEVAMVKGHADYLVATGKMTAAERVQVERNAEEQIYALQLSFLEQRLLLMATEAAEVERINADIVALKNAHNLKVQELDTQQFQTNKQMWDGYFSSITEGFSGTVQGMILQGQTWQEAIGNLLQNVLGQFINMGVKWLMSHITTQTAMTAATTTGAAVRTAAEVSSAATSKAANAKTATNSITNSGASVFGKVYDSIAGIPYVGPFLAPVMAVAAMAGVMGMVGKVASAEGGWDRVPYDGARAILHKEEMVLPAPLAEGIRSMVETGGGQRGGGVTIHALDRRDVQRYFDDNSDVMVRALMQHGDNNPGGF